MTGRIPYIAIATPIACFAIVIAVLCVSPAAEAQDVLPPPVTEPAPSGANALAPESPSVAAPSTGNAAAVAPAVSEPALTEPGTASEGPSPVLPSIEGAVSQPAAPPSLESVPGVGPSAPDGPGAGPEFSPPATLASEGTPSTAAALLPHDLSPWGMFMAADIVVKAVMIGLAFASVITWTVWLSKSIELAWAKRKLGRARNLLTAASSLSEAKLAAANTRGVVPALLGLATTELTLSQGIHDKSAIKERIASRLDGLTLAAGRDMNRGTGVLATIGSTAPFVGLFGTVWGIMNSFIGISKTQTTNLAVVAPGIAEALLATAIGLVAAIPAVIVYNQFARSISGYRASVAEASAEVQRLVSRDLDRGLQAEPLARAAE